ncbi:MAG: WGR domain-containing protein, partial [Proteobacteria bacterium]|nr:WGR domain-containing protein [Pseudomonadota bacterium]
MPRFEFSDGRSNKFWEITLNGNEYHVQYGRIGTVGQSSNKSFPDAATAKKKYEAAIKGKVKKGYLEISQTELAADEDEEAARLVLADTLQQEGDPRGTLIALQHRKEQVSGKERSKISTQERALFEEHQEAFLGIFATDGPKACFKCEWKLGYWDKVVIFSNYDHEDIKTGELLKAALKHPSGQQLRELQCGIPESVWDGESDWQQYIDIIADVGAPELEKLHLADDDDNAEISWCEIGNLGAIWKVIPKLEYLRIRGISIFPGDIDAPKL